MVSQDGRPAVIMLIMRRTAADALTADRLVDGLAGRSRARPT